MKESNTTNCSLVVATYNWPQALNVCLHSIKKQSILPTEVIIADDGSRDETKHLIDRFKENFPVPLVHIWQPDEGFQLAKIRNKAFAACKYEYVIQIDGDLILHSDFVKDHIELSKQGTFITGSRILLGPDISKKVIEDEIISFGLINKNSKNFLNGVRIPLLRNLLRDKYKMKGKNKYYVKGCNMAFWKKDLIKVNGYNESFIGWGREDSEIAIRLMNSGVKKQFIKMGGICYHLYHKEASRELEAKNVQQMEDAITQKIIRAPLGLDQYLSINH